MNEADDDFDDESEDWKDKSDRTDDRHRRGRQPDDECEWWDDIVHAYEDSFDNE